MEKYFYLHSHPAYQDKYSIYFNFPEKYFPKGTSGSYDVFIARLLGLSYPDYLRWARDRLGAELIGKNKKYVTVLFDNNETVQTLVKILNLRLEFIINEREFPYDYKEEDGKVERVPFEEDESNE